ncbi:Fc.00g114290.m01.CDS01 [Cosmosporella sp. VM-42]
MKGPTLIAAALAAPALAFYEPNGHEFRPASPFDSRSPCPGLNALANHGFLPRNGMNLDYDQINKAAKEAYNFQDGFYINPVNMVFEFNISTTATPGKTFNLRDLARHDAIEVDGSLTRNDIYFGDDLHFDATVWAPLAKDLELEHGPQRNRYVTVDTAAIATKNRLALAKSANPSFNASAFQHSTEYGTTALYLLTVWDQAKKAAPKEWVKALLSEDRIAYREGYSKGKVIKTGKDIQNMTAALRAVAGWQP